MKRNNDIRIARFLAGEMSANEEIAFRNSYQDDPQKINELSMMEKQWKAFEENSSGRNWDSHRAWENLKHRIEDEGLLIDLPGNRRDRVLAPYLRAAGIVLLILAIGIPAFFVARNPGDLAPENQTVFSGTSGSTVDLPDGSRVFLNNETEITYQDDFSRKREVRLKGEAYFEVMSDPANPFIVRSGKVVVSVLGTSFNVKQVTRSQDVEVYVASGKVRISREDGEGFMTLEMGQFGRSGKLGNTPGEMKDPNYLSWKTKDFKFVDSDLTDVLKELEESYHVSIHMEGIDTEGLKITTTYSEQSLEAILETIGTAFGWKVNQQRDGYYLTN